MFGEAAVLDPDNIRSDPSNRPTVSREASVDNNIVALRNDAPKARDVVEQIFLGTGRMAHCRSGAASESAKQPEPSGAFSLRIRLRLSSVA